MLQTCVMCSYVCSIMAILQVVWFAGGRGDTNMLLCVVHEASPQIFEHTLNIGRMKWGPPSLANCILDTLFSCPLKFMPYKCWLLMLKVYLFLPKSMNGYPKCSACRPWQCVKNVSFLWIFLVMMAIHIECPLSGICSLFVGLTLAQSN